MNPLFHTDFSISDSLKFVWKSVLIYDTIIEYAKGKAKHPKCNSPHRIDVDDVMENLTEVLRKIAQYSLANKEEFEVLVKSSLAKEQTEEIKKQKSVSHKSQIEWNR